ncbi:hypothetical protein FACS189479_09530 [Spirochaetia bacterium]|nr:hypothetical protein FACS189479_09530 [Spirochaetia bacterium]
MTLIKKHYGQNHTVLFKCLTLFGPVLTLPLSRKIVETEDLYELRVQQGNNICRLFYFYYSELKDEQFRKEYEQLEDEFNLAEEVLKLRQKQNLSQNDLAKIAGTSQPAIARLESGKYQNVSLSFLRKIGKALNVIPEVHFKAAE